MKPWYTLLLTEAAKTYFTSVAGLAKMKSKGKYKDKCAQQRRKNRIKRVSSKLIIIHQISVLGGAWVALLAWVFFKAGQQICKEVPQVYWKAMK